MSSVLRPDLLDVDPAEVADFLLTTFTGAAVALRRQTDGLLVDVSAAAEADINTALDGWTPTTKGWSPDPTAPVYQPPVPDAVKTAVAYLKQAAAAGDNSAKASLVLFRWLNQRLNSLP